MRKSRFTEAQIVAALKEGEAGVAVAEIIRKHGISRNTYFNWKAKHGRTTVNELRRLRELEATTLQHRTTPRQPRPGAAPHVPAEANQHL